MRFSRMRRLLAAMSVVPCVAGCGLLGASPDQPTSTTGPVEQSHIRLSLLPLVGTAPAYIAIDKGYFRDEGLDVQLVAARNSKDVVDKVIAKEAEIGEAAYPAEILPVTKAVAPLKIVADSYQECEGHAGVMVLPDSPIKRIQDLAGRKIGVLATGSLSDLAVKSEMAANSVDYSKIQWVPLAAPDMESALTRGDVEAIVPAEPFVTLLQRHKGARTIFDLAKSGGPTADISLSGFVSREEWANAHPNTVQAFVRAMHRADDAAKADRPLLEGTLSKQLNIDKEVAALIHVCTWPSTLAPTRLQRVADLMARFGLIPAAGGGGEVPRAAFKVEGMLWAPPATATATATATTPAPATPGK